MAKSLQDSIDEARRREEEEWGRLSEEEKLAQGGRWMTTGGGLTAGMGRRGVGGGFTPQTQWKPYKGAGRTRQDELPQFRRTDFGAARREDIAKTQAEWSANVPQGYTRSFGAQMLATGLAETTGRFAGLEAQQNIAQSEFEARQRWEDQANQLRWAQQRQSGQLGRRELRLREEAMWQGARATLKSLSMRQHFGILDRLRKTLGWGTPPAGGGQGAQQGQLPLQQGQRLTERGFPTWTSGFGGQDSSSTFSPWWQNPQGGQLQESVPRSAFWSPLDDEEEFL